MEFPKHWLTVAPFVVLRGAVLVVVPLAKILGRMGFIGAIASFILYPSAPLSACGQWRTASSRQSTKPLRIRRLAPPPSATLVSSVLYFDFAPFSLVDPRY